MNEDQENYPIAFKFHKSLWDILYDVPYKFLRDWVIFGRFMLFLMRTFWFVKFKRKKNSDCDVTFCEILQKFIGNMRYLVLHNLWKLQVKRLHHSRSINCRTKSYTEIAMKKYLLSVWTVYMASKTKKVRKNAKIFEFIT